MDGKSIMLNFLDTIKEISSLKPNLLYVQKLQVQLRCLSNVFIHENDEQLLMECVLKYIDFIINVSSIKGFRDQIKICRNSFSIITEIISEQVQTTFVRTITKRVFDIVIEDDVKSWCVKKELLKAYISCIQKANKIVRQETVQELPNIYLFKMVDSVSTYGDYDLQVTLIETVFRMYGKSTITSKLKDLIPESQQLSESFAEINGDTFDEDVRNFLNALNETSGKVFSVMCKSVHLGNIKCGEPMDNVNGLWVDFNLSESAITWYCNKNSFSDNKMDTEDLDESNDRIWNLITLFVSDVESVQIHRPVKSEDVLIFFKFKESCISSFDDNQAIIGAANDLKLVVSYNSKKIANLLSKVLPYLFKNKFFHNSSKVSSNKKSVYKPLNVTVSRKTKSDSSKTKSDTSSFATFFDATSGKSNKSDLSTTSKDDINLYKGYMSSVSSICEVVSIPDSSTTATEQSLEFMPLKDKISENAPQSISSEYETAEICPNAISEINRKVSKNIVDMSMINMNKLTDIKISKAKIDNSLVAHSSFNNELFNVQEDIERIQILSRRCSVSNVRYSQLNKNSRLTDSTLKKVSRFSKSNEDRITKNYICSSQNKGNIVLTELKTEESSTPSFQTVADENGQTLTNATKISKSIDVLCEAKIFREKMSDTQNFETADSRFSNKTVKISKPKDILLKQYASNRNFQKVVDNNLNLNKPNKINKPKDMSMNANYVLTESLKSGATVYEKSPINSDIHNLTQEILHSNKPNEVDVENETVDNNLRENKNLAIITKEYDAMNFPKDNQKIDLLDNKNNFSSMVQDAENALTSGNISKCIYSGWNITEINSKCEETHIKCSAAMNLCPAKKRKQKHDTKFDWPNEIIVDDSNKENLEVINSLNKRVKSQENKKGDIKDKSNKSSLPKQLLVENCFRTANEDTVINVEEQIPSRKKALEVAALTNNSNKKKKSPDILDKEASSRNRSIIQHTKLVGREVQTLNDFLISSIDKNFKENQVSNNFNLIKTFTNKTDIKNSYSDDISSEDEIPLKQLIEKWKDEKFKPRYLAHHVPFHEARQL